MTHSLGSRQFLFKSMHTLAPLAYCRVICEVDEVLQRFDAVVLLDLLLLVGGVAHVSQVLTVLQLLPHYHDLLNVAVVACVAYLAGFLEAVDHILILIIVVFRMA